MTAGAASLSNLNKRSEASTSGGLAQPSTPQKQPRAPPAVLVYGTLFAVQVIFVLWFFVAKIAMAAVDLPPLVFAMWREVVAAVCLVIAVHATGTASDSHGGVGLATLWPHRRAMAVLGLLMFGNVIGFIYGLSLVTSFNAAIFQPTQPVFATLIAWAIGSEQMSVAKALAIAMASGGAALTVYFGTLGSAGDDAVAEGGDPAAARAAASAARESAEQVSLGNAVLLAQCICGGCMWVLQKRVLKEVRSPLLVTAVSYLVAAALTTLVTLMAYGPWDPRLYVSSAIGWAAILYAALFATVVTYWAMGWANQHASPSTVTVSLALQPLLTAVFIALGGGAALAGEQVVSCALILAGLFLKVVDSEKERGKGPSKMPSAATNLRGVP